MSSAWTIEFDPLARKQLRKLDRTVADRILDTLERDIARHDHPRDFGEAMVGNWSGFWRYRVGDYRVICRIEDERVTVYVIALGHRREIYR